jgi:outer membrane protein OmpA-like peptidoglycan-associated protein
MRMNHLLLRVLIVLAMLAAAGSALAQPSFSPNSPPNAVRNDFGPALNESVMGEKLPAINVQPGQPSDPNFRVKEPARFSEMQARIVNLKALNKACPFDYHLAKAQAWLNFSRDQYHENAWQKDIQVTTLGEANRIVTALEKNEDPGMDTPLVSSSAKIRADLWRMAEKVKQATDGTLCCGEAQTRTLTAFCEVQLVWSGHAMANLGGWRRANPIVGMAEDLCNDAARQVCRPAAPIIAEPLPMAPAYEKVTLTASALFKHGKSAIDDILPGGRSQLDQLASKIRQVQGIESMIISGHADITNSTKDPDYNDKLSLARANTVRSYLTLKGVNPGNVEIQSLGARQPVKTDCAAPPGTVMTPGGLRKGRASDRAMKAFQECLQPNRRVAIEIFGQTEKK